MNQSIQRVADECISHLGEEKQLVGDVQNAISSLRGQILAKDTPANLESHIAELVGRVQDFANRRLSLRTRIAQVLNLNVENATIGQLAEVCDTNVRSQLVRHRQELLEASKGVYGGAASTLNLVGLLMRLNETIFCSLTGKTARPAVYERNGRPSY